MMKTRNKGYAIFLTCLIVSLILPACSLQQSDSEITVLPDRVEGTQPMIVNGGAGVTEASFFDRDGNPGQSVSNVIEVPRQEICDQDPASLGGEPTIGPEQDPNVLATNITAIPLQNQMVIAAAELPDVNFRTEANIPTTPPKIRLVKSADEQVLCCDSQLTYRIRYINEGGDEAYNIKIFDVIPANTEYLEDSAGSEPYFANVDFDRVEDGKVTKIHWLVEGPIPPGGEGEVSFSVVCPTVRPKLNCSTIFAPKSILPGETGDMIVTVNNTGTGPAKNTLIKLTLPKGVELVDQPGQTEASIDIGVIDAGSTSKNTYKIKVTEGGILDRVTASIAVGNGEGCECSVASAPVLAVQRTSIAKITNAKEFDCNIVATNIGEKAPGNNTVLVDKLPPDTKFVRATDEGKYDKETHTVTWQLGTMNPGDSVKRTVTVVPRKNGSMTGEATVSCVEGAKATDPSTTFVDGQAAVHISKYDTEDPVAVGETTTYVIEIRNEGFDVVTGVVLKAVIPELGEFVTGKGTGANGEELATTSEDRNITFATLNTLESGERAVYNVTVRVKAKGELLFRCILQYNEFDKPLITEEPTMSYE